MRIAVSCVLLFVVAFVLTLGGQFIWNSRGNRLPQVPAGVVPITAGSLPPDARSPKEPLRAQSAPPDEPGSGVGKPPPASLDPPAADQWDDRLQTYRMALVESDSVAVRMSAVVALRDLADSHAGTNDKALELLRIATSDADSLVAAAAKDAYQVISARKNAR